MRASFLSNSTKRLVMLITLLVIGVALTVDLTRAAFSTAIDLTPGKFANFPSLEIGSTGVIHATWAEDVSGNQEIIYAKSTDDGATFPNASRINVSSSPGFFSTRPWIEVDSANTIYIVWEEETAAGTSEIYFVKSTDSGASFTTPVNVSNNSTHSVSPKIESSTSGKINVVWTNETADSTQVFYASSTNGGTSFTTPVNISNTTHSLDNAAIKANGSTLVVVWQGDGSDYGIYKVRSSDNGANWGTASLISSTAAEQTLEPFIVMDGSDRFHVAYQRGAEIYHIRSTDGGLTFGAETNVSGTSASSEKPRILAFGVGSITVIWAETECADTCQRVTYRAKSGNGGNSFGASVRISGPSGEVLSSSAEDSDIETFSNKDYIIWQESNTVKFSKGT